MGIPPERIGGPSETARNELAAAVAAYPRSFTPDIFDPILAMTTDPPDQSLTLPVDGTRSQIKSEGGGGRIAHCRNAL